MQYVEVFAEEGAIEVEKISMRDYCNSDCHRAKFESSNEELNTIFEAARLDGVGWVREIFQLIIPLIWPTFSVMFLQSIVGITQASGPVYLFTKGENHTYTINYWLYEQLLDGNNNKELSSAIGWICTAFTFPIALVVRHVLDKIDDKIGV